MAALCYFSPLFIIWVLCINSGSGLSGESIVHGLGINHTKSFQIRVQLLSQHIKERVVKGVQESPNFSFATSYLTVYERKKN